MIGEVRNHLIAGGTPVKQLLAEGLGQVAIIIESQTLNDEEHRPRLFVVRLGGIEYFVDEPLGMRAQGANV